MSGIECICPCNSWDVSPLGFRLYPFISCYNTSLGAAILYEVSPLIGQGWSPDAGYGTALAIGRLSAVFFVHIYTRTFVIKAETLDGLDIACRLYD